MTEFRLHSFLTSISKSQILILLLVLLLCCGVPIQVSGEGTRELTTTSTHNARLRLNYEPDVTSTDGGPFGTPVAPPEYRLWVTVGASTEQVHFGFQRPSGSSNDFSFVIKNEAGVVVYPASGTPTPIPTTGSGYIASYTEAINGPKIVNPLGYEQLTFSPPAAGDYYFEFSWPSALGTRFMNYFDITVVDAGGIERRGRVWSKNWQMQMSNNTSPFTGTMYPYTNDQITTSIYFNGMAPARFTVACNPTGVSNTGNFLIDRKSVAGNQTYPEYRIFLNNPDENLFPTGILGGVDSVQTVNTCDGELDIILYVNKPGVADIVLQINPLPGVQPEDINLSDSVYNGNSTTITWDGLNGLGVPVVSGTSIEIEITYVNGLTHLPLYDVEYSTTTGPSAWKGFVVDLIRPAGSKPKTFWDDTGIGGAANLTGCVDPAGCHSWGFVGDEKTINTWWFALSTTWVPIDIVYKRSESYEHTYSICDGDSVLIQGIYRTTAGLYYDSSLNTLGCDSVHIHNLSVRPSPVVNLGSDIIICQGESHTFSVPFDPENSYLWNTGNHTHQITVSTTGDYTVNITNKFNCTRSDTAHLFVSPLPSPVPIRHE